MKTININRQRQVPKGFLSTNGNPTINSIVMFFVYWNCVPKDWNKNVIYLPAVDIVREYFKIDYGFENMIRWGINHGCCKSKTSSGRHNSMSKANVLSLGLIGSGVVLSDISIIDFISRIRKCG